MTPLAQVGDERGDGPGTHGSCKDGESRKTGSNSGSQRSQYE